MLRTFVALALPEPALRQLASAQMQLDETSRRNGTRLRLTPSHQFHITLAFLGDVATAQVQPIIEATREVAAQHSGCHLVPRALVAFPSTRRARVIVVTYEEISGNLSKLVSVLHDRLRECGCSLENRAFRAHVTLARLRKAQQMSLQEVATGPLAGPILCQRIVVFESELKATGAEHRPLGHAELGIA